MSYEVTFADNTEVTLENMNDIVKDLGDTEFTEFSNNKFGVDALNAITSDLVSAGILLTEENAAMGCEPVISGANVIISPGVIVFNTGAKIRIEESISVPKTNSTYIFARNDHLTGIASILVSEASPTNQMDFVQICRIDSEGAMIDLRSPSVAKIPLSAEQENIGILKHITHGQLFSGDSFEVNLGVSGWKYIVYKFSDSNNGTGGCVELDDGGQIVNAFPDSNVSSHDVLRRTTVTRNGSVLRFVYMGSSASSGAIDLEFELR